MGQITTGIRSILSHTYAYSAFQNLMGARAKRQEFVSDFIRPEPGNTVLDIGCGPAEILDYLPNVKYWGFDISAPYISYAKEHFGERGNFSCKVLHSADLESLPKFDIVLAIGLLHHVDDVQADNLLELAYQALKPGGRLLTLDPCIDSDQNYFARFLVMHDRGQNVRTRDGYSALATRVFSRVQGEVRHQTWIPYTHFMMECTK